ncbi:type IV secretory system conjugative DNA transfer family protein [Rhodosalinus sp. 5P4]|uniref:type IV secretory system conjugative DNA transfer family protein n=1 Tax=Rhodosalinus sp. 5P4 TaxID=3239196 RepID=UPI003526748F
MIVGDWSFADLPVYYEDTHAITFGPSGSGKGTAAILPAILDARFVFINDPGGENAAIAIREWRAKGYKVTVINPFGMHPEKPWALPRHGFNPMDILDPKDPQFPAHAELLAEMLTPRSGREAGSSQFFKDSGQTFKQALNIHTRTARPKDQHHLGTLYEMVNLSAEGWGKLLKEMQANPAADGLVAAEANAMERREEQAPEEFSAIMSTIQQDLRWLADPIVRQNLKRSDVDFTALKGTDRNGRPVKGCIIVVVLPLEYSETHAAIPRLAMGCAIWTMQRAPLAREKVLFVIDEAAALRKISRFPNWLATLRKYRVVLWPIFQNIGQVKALYGQEWQGFIANCGLRQFLGAADLETAEYIHRLVGERTAESRSVNAEGKASTSETRRPLLTVDEILHFDGDKQIAFIRNLKPAILRKTRYWERASLRGRFNRNPYQSGRRPPAFGALARRLWGKALYSAAFLLAPHPAAALIYLAGLGYGLFRLWEFASHVL